MKRLMVGAGLLATVAVVAVAAAPLYAKHSAGLSVSPTRLAFGSVAQDSSSTPQTITLTNNTTGTLDLAVVYPSDFHPDNGTTTCSSSISWPLDGNTSCSLGVVFQPKSTGKKHEQLKISYKSASCSARPSCWSTVTVKLSGTGT